jgi:hypothetical protein
MIRRKVDVKKTNVSALTLEINEFHKDDNAEFDNEIFGKQARQQ